MRPGEALAHARAYERAVRDAAAASIRDARAAVLAAYGVVRAAILASAGETDAELGARLGLDPDAVRDVRRRAGVRRTRGRRAGDGLRACVIDDAWCVVDATGRVWWPSCASERAILASETPATTALGLCRAGAEGSGVWRPAGAG